MKKLLIAIFFGLLISSTVFAMSNSRSRHHNGDSHRPNPGGSGVPEPVSVALILAGGAAAYGIKKAIKK